MFHLETSELNIKAAQHRCDARFATARDRALNEQEELGHAADMKIITDERDKISRMQADSGLPDAIKAMAAGGRGFVVSHPQASLGEQFLASEAGDWLKKTSGTRSGQWRAPDVELAAALSEDPASGGPLVLPDQQPGIVPTPQPAITVARLFAPGRTDSNAVGYMREKTFTNAAAPVLEGGVKPESALTFDAVTQALKKLAHWLPVTDEMLEDSAQIRSYIDARLRYGVEIVLDHQLINGDGVGANLLGILATPGLAPTVPQGAGSAFDAVAAQISAITLATGLTPDGIVLNPSDWQFMRVAKNPDGTYAGTGPFAAPQRPTLWGLPVAQTKALAAGTAIVGAFRTAGQVFTRGGIRVEASNSHQNFFVLNMTAIRAEIRAALALYRPEAFGLVTGLTAPVVTP